MPGLLQKHQVVTAQLIITGASSGVARFVNAQSLPEELVREGVFRSKQFMGFKDGETVQATFRISGQSRHLQSVHHISGQSVQTTEPEIVRAPVVNTEGEFIEGIFFTPRSISAFKAADQVARKFGAANMVITGASGYGKTSMAKAFATRTGRAFQRFNCALVTDTEEWFGYREARDGSTVFVPTQFTEMVRAGNCVILLDEFNRIEPWLSNSLMPLLDDDRSTVVHGETITCGPNVVFVKTMNVGYQYVGVFEVDRAQMNRNDIYLEVGPLPKQQEIKLLVDRSGVGRDVAAKIVQVMEDLRKTAATDEMDVDVTTRSALKVAYLAACGTPLRMAFELAIVMASQINRKGVTDIVTARVGMLEDGYTSTF